MNVSQVRTYLNEKASPPPTDPVAYQKWLEFTDTIEFLLYSASGQVPVYIVTVQKAVKLG